MSRHSVGEAGVSGLALIFKKPVSVLAWGLVYLVVVAAPVLVMFGQILPDVLAMSLQPPTPGTLPPGLMASMTRLQSLNMFVNLGSIVAHAVIFCAICRAVLQPRASAFGYLRLGKQELWVGLVTIVLGILSVIAILALVIPVAIIVLVAHAFLTTGGTVLVGVLAGLAAAGVLIWAGLRLSLALPMTFAAGEFRLFESWALTRGEAGRILLTYLIAMVVAWLAEMVVGCLLMSIVIGGLFGGHLDPEALRPMILAGPAVWWPRLAPWIGGGVLLFSLFAGAATAIGSTPIVTIYRALAPKPKAQPEPSPEPSPA